MSGGLLSACSPAIDRFAAASSGATGNNDPEPPGPRYVIGQPYASHGRWHVPQRNPRYDAQGRGVIRYAPEGSRRTANGELFDRWALLAAHPTLPLPSLIEVTNLDSGCRVLLRVNDRGPASANALLGVTPYAADLLGFEGPNPAPVRVRYIRPAPLAGTDGAEQAFLVRTRDRGCWLNGWSDGWGAAPEPRPQPQRPIVMLPGAPPVARSASLIRPWQPSPPPRPIAPLVVWRPAPPQRPAPAIRVAPPPVRTIARDTHLGTERASTPRTGERPCPCAVPRSEDER